MNRVTFFDISKSVVKIVFYLQKLKIPYHDLENVFYFII